MRLLTRQPRDEDLDCSGCQGSAARLLVECDDTNGLTENPFSDHVCVFRGRRAIAKAALWFDGDGLCLFSKRLESGVSSAAGCGWHGIADAARSFDVLEGIDWRRRSAPTCRAIECKSSLDRDPSCPPIAACVSQPRYCTLPDLNVLAVDALRLW